MLSFIVKRILFTFLVMLGVSVVVFSAMYLVPGDAAEIIAKQIYGADVKPETIEIVRKELNLDKPAALQYFTWLKNIFRGDLGTSFQTNNPVFSEIIQKLPATLQLTIASILVSLLISIPLGIISALKKNTPVDDISMFGALFGVSIPNFWLGLILILFFSVNLGVLPVYGYGSFKHIILPAITLGTGMAAITTRMMRSNMLEELSRDYIRTAEGKGLNRLGITKHASKNSLLPVVTIIGLQFGSLMEGAVVVEVVFAWPGIGRLLVESIFARDFPLIQGCVLMIAAIYSVTNLVVDISYAYLNPRIHYGAKHD